MLMKLYQTSFIFLLFSGTLIAISSSSWFMSWVGLELNLMMMIPLIISRFDSNSTESSIKYFLVQAMASLMFILSSTVVLFFTKMNFVNEMNMIFIMALMVKSGVPPFHFWFPQVIELSYWTQCFIILTWQKIAPFVLISYMYHKSIYIYIMMGAFIGTIGGFNQNSMKKILTYSSIIHSSWMLSIIILNKEMWMKYFLIYSFITFSIIFMVYFSEINNIKKMMTSNFNKNMKMVFLFSILSLGGLPPFLGFLAKFMVASIMISQDFSWIILISLIGSSLMALFFYCKMIYISMIIFNMKTNFIFIKSNKNMKMFPIYVTIFMNFIAPSLVLLA